MNSARRSLGVRRFMERIYISLVPISDPSFLVISPLALAVYYGDPQSRVFSGYQNRPKLVTNQVISSATPNAPNAAAPRVAQPLSGRRKGDEARPASLAT